MIEPREIPDTELVVYYFINTLYFCVPFDGADILMLFFDELMNFLNKMPDKGIKIIIKFGK